MNRLQRDGQNGTLKPDDLTGGTFSLSNIGVVSKISTIIDFFEKLIYTYLWHR